MTSPRQLWLLPVLLITVIATALGALVARSLYADQTPAPPVAIEPSQPSVQPGEQPGPTEVQGTTDATTHPLYTTLQPLLQRYFDAINAKDYAAWTQTVTTTRQHDQDEADWQRDYRTTRDGSIVIHRIEAGGGGTASVLLQFTSTQDLADAPLELPATCIQWYVVWAFAKQKDEWRLAAGSTSASPQHDQCPGQ
ncbi:hypothetical protein [Actinophytocola oryzae]|uniref:Uncharacterized protein n=1 Tax=Actinophytocola oryzae TaxID=502181 RepID=A0A4V3FQN9_9PSEU|nr:hypothetical protein [Actinophytocola oryzae]TDV40461.1 hypothetical protein CLV71_123172 [Actinophytocola oryzae]